MSPQPIPPAVLAAIESVFLDRAAVWGEGYRVRIRLSRRGKEEEAAWMEAHPDIVAAGWKEGFAAGGEALTRESLRAKLMYMGPIIPDEPPEPGAIPAPVNIVPKDPPAPCRASGKKRGNPDPALTGGKVWF